MTVTGTEIQDRAFPRATAVRVTAVGAFLVVALGVGLVVGRVTAPRSETNKATAPQSVISTRWLDDTPTVRHEIMEKMNGIPVETSPYIDKAALRLRVMQHMNELSPPDASYLDRGAVAVRVMRHMNEILASRSA
jgi:hypothetical protein